MSKELTKWIADYDAGQELESVSMGGMGSGYELAIQSCAVEIIRNLQGIEPPEDINDFRQQLSNAEDKAVALLNNRFGFSGAQVGAAKNIASVFWRKTPQGGIDKMKEQDPDRVIKIKKGADSFVELVDYKEEA